MKAFRVSTRVSAREGWPLVSDCGQRLDIKLPVGLGAAYHALVDVHEPGRTVLQLNLGAGGAVELLALGLAPDVQPLGMLAQAYAHDALALDTLARLHSLPDWFALCSGRRFVPEWYSPDHLALVSAPSSGPGPTLLLTDAEGDSLPLDRQTFRLMVVEHSEGEPLYDSGFWPGHCQSHLPPIAG